MLAVLAGLLYFAASRGSLELIDESLMVAAAWPASGVALAALIATPRRRWPVMLLALLAGALAAQFWARAGAPAAGVVLAFVNVGEAALGAVAWRLAARLWRARDGGVETAEVIGLLAAIGVTAAPAVAGAVTVHLAFGAALGPAITTWWLADGIGMLLAAPIALVALRPNLRAVAPAKLAIAAVVLQAVVCLAIFGSSPDLSDPDLNDPFIALPLLLLLALAPRRQQLATALAIVVTGVIASAATVAGLGPFSTGSLPPIERIESLQIFLGVSTIATLLTAAIVGERTRAQREQRELASMLEGVLDAAIDFSVIGTDLEGRITVFNEGAERMLGYRAGETIGKTPALIHDASEIEARAAELGLEPGFDVFVHALGGGGSETRDWTYVTAAGQRLTVSLTVSALRGPDGPTGYIGIAQDITEARAAEAARAAAQARTSMLLANLPDASVLLFDADLRIIVAEGDLVPNSGMTSGELCGQLLGDALAYAEPKLRPPLEAALRGERTNFRFHSPRSGVHYDLEAVPFAPAGEVEGAFMVLRDVTAQHEQEQKIEQGRAKLATIFESAPIGQAVLDRGGYMLEANAAMLRVLGHERSHPSTLRLASHVDVDDAGAFANAIDELRDGVTERFQLEIRATRADGQHVDLRANGVLLDAEAGHVLVQVEDVTEQRRHREQLQHLADHDALTGLPNRRRFERALEDHIELVRRYGADGALMLLDIDHFKLVNDSLGHSVGDELIVTVGQLLERRLRTTDLIARIGGDEFAILLPRTHRAGAEVVARALVTSVREASSQIAGVTRPVSISLGVTMLGVDREQPTAEGAMIDADLAMYDAKEAGRDGFAFFSGEGQLPSQAKQRMLWHDRIRAALATGGFELLAQPIASLRAGGRPMHELLIRLVGEDGELIPPGLFLDVAERFGLMPVLDRWVIEKALDLLAEVQQRDPGVVLSVNLSGQSLGDDELAAFIAERIDLTGVDPRGLVFEITETVAVADLAAARRLAEQLGALQCRLALDDFGSGYSSFHHLKHLPADLVKIDGEFVKSCVTDAADQLMIRLVTQLAQGLGKQTVAEFVEDAATLELLRELGVDYVQGYHVGRPAPLAHAFGTLPASLAVHTAADAGPSDEPLRLAS